MSSPADSDRAPRISRNVWAASLTSFLTDVSSEMVLNLVPLFLAHTLGVRTSVIGVIEGVAESTASLLKVFSGSFSDRLRRRKGLAVAGYAISTLAKPGFALATSWSGIGAARFADRVGKGIRTAPRDALLADSTLPSQRGLAYGLHRAADTGGAVVGLAIAIGVLAVVQQGADGLGRDAFRTLALVSLVPAALGVLALAVLVREAPRSVSPERASGLALRGLGSRFLVFLGLSALFDLGNSSDAFLVLRASERGLGASEILWILLAFNAVYALVSTPAGSLSDRIGRRRILLAGWLFYAVVYLGFARAETAGHVVGLYLAYGAYQGLSHGTARAFVADLVPAERRGAAFGAYHATLGLIDLPASILAGVLWQGLGSWNGFGPSAPFYFGAAAAAAAAIGLAVAFREDRPRLIVVCGQIASGKSTVAARVAGRLGAHTISADEVRVDLYEHGAREAFVPGFSANVYPEVERRARELLAAGQTVVLDGTFRTRALRREAQALASAAGTRVLFIECQAGAEACRNRLRQREARDGHPGWLERFDAFLTEWEPLDELAAAQHRILDTSEPRPPETLELEIERLVLK